MLMTGSFTSGDDPTAFSFEALRSVLVDSNWQAQAVLQYLGGTPWKIDPEMGDLADAGPLSAPLLSYFRYDLVVEPDRTGADLADSIGETELRDLALMGRPETIDRLLALAREAAEVRVGRSGSSRRNCASLSQKSLSVIATPPISRGRESDSFLSGNAFYGSRA